LGGTGHGNWDVASLRGARGHPGLFTRFYLYLMILCLINKKEKPFFREFFPQTFFFTFLQELDNNTIFAISHILNIYIICISLFLYTLKTKIISNLKMSTQNIHVNIEIQYCTQAIVILF